MDELTQLAYNMRQHLDESGLGSDVHRLIRGVWRHNQDRHDPDLAGDTARGLGFQSSENIREIAMRSPEDGGLNKPRAPWSVSVDQNSLVLSTALGNIHLKKLAVLDDGRTPDWNALQWKTDSRVRYQIATHNSARLGMLATPAQQDVLEALQFPEPSTPSGVAYIIGWTGHTMGPLTSGYLFVPVLGEDRALCRLSLWHDEPRHGGTEEPKTPSVTPGNFDELPGPKPTVRLRLRPQDQGDAK